MEIGIIGLGLIGGSLGIDLRLQGHKIIGISRQEKTAEFARQLGAVDQAGTDFKLLTNAEIIIICTPIEAIASTLQQISKYISTETIITDVGSVKHSVVQACAPLWSNFVGGHPMAGKTEAGIGSAQANLFAGAAYVFTPTTDTNQIAVEKLREIAISLRAVPYICDAQIHDRAVSYISHLPVMVSAGLITTCLAETDNNVLQLAKSLASSGFRDTSRVGGGIPELGVMMAKYNRNEILRALDLYRNNLDQIKALIEQKNWQQLEKALQINHQVREEFLN